MSMLIQPFSELGATNDGQRVDAGRGSRAATIPERTDQQAGRRRRGHRGGRPPAFDPNSYRRRNVVERCINRLTQWRGIATRYDKR
jgi:transposase